MIIIDGRKIAGEILEGLKKEVEELPFKPVFYDLLVGDDPVSMSYVRIKGRSAEKIGIGFKMGRFKKDIFKEELISEIKRINQEENLCGLIIQLPLPKHLPRQEVLNSIDPEIDVDCLGEERSKKFYSGDFSLVLPTASAVMFILDSLKADLAKKNILVIGQGPLVGKPVSFLFRKRNIKHNIADEFTKNTAELMTQADIIITATGQAGLITGSKIKPGSIIIDAGTSESNGRVVGDVDFESVSAIASYLSPVPGGVGPVTVSQLLKNVVSVAKNKIKNNL